MKLRRRSGDIDVGPGYPTRINALVGISSKGGVASQQRKIAALATATSKPDVVSDLTIIQVSGVPLWRQLLNESDFVVGTLPVYTATRQKDRIDQSELLAIAVEQMEAGVGLVTIHPTASREIMETTSTRMVPITSRGGSIIVRDLLCSTAQDNVYLRILPDLISHARRTSAVLSIGATFRSATIFDSCDEAQLLELDSQLRLARDIQEAGVGVIIETPGHARPRDIQRIATLLRPTGFPIMPLGPIPTDCAIGQDHVSAAIGAALLGLAGCAHILAAVTREEHTGGVPSIASTIEAVEAARVAAHIIDLETLNADQLDMIVAQGRAEHRSCVSGKKSRGCARCADVCPL